MTASTVRLARRDLRRAGCTCHPTVTLLTAGVVGAAGPAGATAGAVIRHEAGCALGDRVLEQNRLGNFPALITTGSRCSR